VIDLVYVLVWVRSSTVDKVLLYKSEGHWFDRRWCHGIFHWHKSFWSHSTHLLKEMSTRRISGGKCGRCVSLTTLPQSCSVVMKSGNLSFLENSRPLQACNGTALPLLETCLYQRRCLILNYDGNGLTFLFRWSTEYTESQIVPCSYSRRVRTVAGPFSNVISANIPGHMESYLVTKHNFDCGKFVRLLQVLKV
jgi:hypothetical protein